MAGYSQTELIAEINKLSGLEGADKFDFNYILYMNSFKVKDVKDDAVLLSEVRDGRSMPIFLRQDDWDAFQTVTEGSCKLPSAEIADDWSLYKFKMGEIGEEIPICMKKFTTDFNRFWNTWPTDSEKDLSTAIVQFIAERFQSRHLKAESRVFFFGDSAQVANTKINATDGIFTQAIAQATANPELRVTIAENAAATPEGQLIKDGEVLLNYYKAAIDKMTYLPDFDTSKMKLYIDRVNAQTLVNWLNNQAELKGVSCDCIDPERVTKAGVFTVDNLAISGIPTVVHEFQEMMKGAGEPYYTAADQLFLHRNIFLLSRTENVLLGYEVEESLKNTDLFYDRRENEIIIKGSSKLAPGLPTDAFVVGY